MPSESAKPRKRGRPRTPATPPPDGRWYEWADDTGTTLGPQVKAIVGDRDDNVHDTDRCQTDDGTILSQLYALTATFLERPLTRVEKARLKTLFHGGPSRLQQTDGRKRRAPKASAITLALIGWKAGLGERMVTSYKKSLRAGTRPALEFLRYR